MGRCHPYIDNKFFDARFPNPLVDPGQTKPQRQGKRRGDLRLSIGSGETFYGRGNAGRSKPS